MAAICCTCKMPIPEDTVPRAVVKGKVKKDGSPGKDTLRCEKCHNTKGAVDRILGVRADLLRLYQDQTPQAKNEFVAAHHGQPRNADAACLFGWVRWPVGRCLAKHPSDQGSFGHFRAFWCRRVGSGASWFVVSFSERGAKSPKPNSRNPRTRSPDRRMKL